MAREELGINPECDREPLPTLSLDQPARDQWGQVSFPDPCSEGIPEQKIRWPPKSLVCPFMAGSSASLDKHVNNPGLEAQPRTLANLRIAWEVGDPAASQFLCQNSEVLYNRHRAQESAFPTRLPGEADAGSDGPACEEDRPPPQDLPSCYSRSPSKGPPVTGPGGLAGCLRCLLIRGLSGDVSFPVSSFCPQGHLHDSQGCSDLVASSALPGVRCTRPEPVPPSLKGEPHL